MVEIPDQEYQNLQARSKELEALIAEHQGREETLRKSNAQLANAVEFARLGPWEYDVAKDLFTFTDSFYTVFRTTAQQVGGYALSSADYVKRFVHPEDAALVGGEVRKALETNDPNYRQQLTHRIIFSDGELGYISVRIFIVKDEKGKTVKTYGVTQDITESMRVEEDMAAKVKELEKLTKIMEGREDKIIELKQEVKTLKQKMAER